MSQVRINYWAEGPTDRAAARKLIRHVGCEPGDDYSIRRKASPGKDFLDKRITSFNAAAHYNPWLVLRDGDGVCAADLSAQLLPRPAQYMCFRVVVPAIEAWLLADRQAFATALAVGATQLPEYPEDIVEVKRCVIELASRSRSRSVREDLPPRPQSGRHEGQGYAQFLIGFINETWHPNRAAKNAPSLRRAIKRLETMC